MKKLPFVLKKGSSVIELCEILNGNDLDQVDAFKLSEIFKRNDRDHCHHQKHAPQVDAFTL